MSRRPILMLVNPAAGGKPGSGPGATDNTARLEPDALADALRDRGLDVRLHVLVAEDDAGALAVRAATEGRDLVVAGGDGTARPVAAVLLGHPDATLGIVALGSFNNVARGYGIPLRLDAALDAIGAGRTSEVDSGWAYRGDPVTGRPFFEAAGVGLDALGFLAIELAERHGAWRAAKAVWRGLRRRRTPMTIRLDGRRLRAGSPAITVSNGPYHGPGFAIAADADPTDGWLDVAIFHGMTRLEVLRHFLAVARHRRRREPRIRTYRAQSVTVEGRRRALPVHVDGESMGMTPVTFEVRPRSLRVFR